METEEIKKVVLNKGDILVLKIKRGLPTANCEKIIECFERVLSKVGLKDDVAVLILDEETNIYGVLTQKEKNIMSLKPEYSLKK